jgi:hypothetical protein
VNLLFRNRIERRIKEEREREFFLYTAAAAVAFVVIT